MTNIDQNFYTIVYYADDQQRQFQAQENQIYSDGKLDRDKVLRLIFRNEESNPAILCPKVMDSAGNVLN
ncbi:hypothetical protein CL42_06375 [Acinetobacter sp. Ver3]|nr:hypothetical protein CL42_06375 [Acinetobacter sp. Ver3]